MIWLLVISSFIFFYSNVLCTLVSFVRFSTLVWENYFNYLIICTTSVASPISCVVLSVVTYCCCRSNLLLFPFWIQVWTFLLFYTCCRSFASFLDFRHPLLLLNGLNPQNDWNDHRLDLKFLNLEFFQEFGVLNLGLFWALCYSGHTNIYGHLT